jgi:glycosyltransferase involved in cell wall biosynthesis
VRNPEIIAAVERYVLPRLDHIITVVEESSERLAALGVPRERLTVVSNTPPAKRADAERPASSRASRGPDEPLHLTYLGLMEVPRGINDVLDALALLRAAGRRVDLCLIGDGRDRVLFEERAASHGLGPDAVRFMGALPNAEALRLVGQADVGLVPHHANAAWNSTIPNKLFDYMAAGLPVVTSDALPAARIVRSSGSGVVYRSGDSADLAQRLEPLFDPAIRERMALAGRQAVRESYNWERDVDALLTALQSAIRAPGGGVRHGGAR